MQHWSQEGLVKGTASLSPPRVTRTHLLGTQICRWALTIQANSFKDLKELLLCVHSHS